MMDIHQQILTSFWENNFNFISMIARIEKTGKDRPLGLMQFYGIQGVAKTIHPGTLSTRSSADNLSTLSSTPESVNLAKRRPFSSIRTDVFITLDLGLFSDE